MSSISFRRITDGFLKSRTDTILVIPAPDHVRDKLQPESSLFEGLWTPAFAGVTGFRTFYEIIKNNLG